MGKARSFSDADDESVYQTESDNENYAQSSQQNPQGLGGGVFNDQSGYGNFSQSGRDQRNAALDGSLFRGNIGAIQQSVVLDVGTNTIDLSEDNLSNAISKVSMDNLVSLSAGTTGELVTILGAQRPGQRLILYGIDGNTITIKNTVALTPDTIFTPDGEDFVLSNTAVVLLVYDVSTSKWRVLSGAGGGTGTGTFVSAKMDQDQTSNMAVNDHFQFNDLVEDGGIVLQGQTPTFDQTSGIFELKAGKTYFMIANMSIEFNANSDSSKIAWFDRTNAVQLGQKGASNPLTASSQKSNAHAAHTIFTPVTDVNVEVRITDLTGTILNAFSDSSQANIFEFSGTTGDGAATITTWKLPARVKNVEGEDLAGFPTITEVFDGITLVQGDRVLLTDQVTASQNGLYQVGVVAGGFAPLTRPSDFDTDAEVLAETFVAVEEGTQAQASTVWHLITNNPITVDVSDQEWELFAPGTAGGPNLGGGADGIDGAGEFVNDGRVAVAFDKLKKWEQINDFVYPNGGVQDLIYLDSQDDTTIPHNRVGGVLVQVGGANLSHPTPVNGSFSNDYGATWTGTIGLNTNFDYKRLAHDPVGDVVVTCASLGPVTPTQANTVKRSTDRGVNFVATAITSGTALFTDIIWSGDDSQFVLLESASGTDKIWTSADGNTWINRTTPDGNWSEIAFDNTSGTYLVTPQVGTTIMTSTDGAVTWNTAPTTGLNVFGAIRLRFSEGQQKFVLLTQTNGTFHSPDGITWTPFNTFNVLTNVQNMIWSPDISLWSVVGESGGTSLPIFEFSNDAETWYTLPVNSFRIQSGADIAIGTSSQTRGIAYGFEFGYFFATGGPTNPTNNTQARAWRTEVFMNGKGGLS